MSPIYEQPGLLPLYKEIRGSYEQTNHAHAGLLFDKFPDAWGRRKKKDKQLKDSLKKKKDYQLEDGTKKDFLEQIITQYTTSKTPIGENLKYALSSQNQLLGHLQGISIEAATDWRFVSGLGSAHPYETGFIWHRILSVPYLPGSSVKGMMRAFATHWSDLSDPEITRLFGTEQDQGQSGALIIFDALPSRPPELQIDILNPHYSEYYQDSSKPPADYLSPKPVFFLTVAPRQCFTFFLASRKGALADDLKKGLDLLLKALEILGAGGKTAVGYGAFQEIKVSRENREVRQNEMLQQQQKKLPDNLSELEQQLRVFLENTSEQEWDTKLLKALEEGRWQGEDAKQVAEKVKQLMEKAKKWLPDFTGTNTQKLKYKERSLKVQRYLND